MLFLFLLFQNPFNILLLQLILFFDLETNTTIKAEGVVEILKTNKTLQTLVLAS
jgi:hypothetical protein